MENRKSLNHIIFSLMGLVLFSLPIISLAYSTETHSNITATTFEEYEKLFGRVFTNKQIELAKKGSIDEDILETKLRPLNHFYDPVNNKGLTIVKFNFFNVTTGMASPVWATDTDKQANFLKKRVQYNDNYFSSPTDFSWDRNVFEYVYGDKNRAVKGLGHILHLIQDTTSSAHTRNDKHPTGDVYETFTKGKKPTNLKIKKREVAQISTLEEIFQQSALFTNNHFFSDDTIFDGYKKPQRKTLYLKRALGYEKGQYFGYSIVQKNKIHLIRIKQKRDKITYKINESYFLKDKQDLIMSDYWKVLSRRAVLSGVEVIDLFFREVEKEKKTLALKGKNKSRAEKALAKLRPKGFNLAKGLYGSSLTNKDVRELLGEKQTGAVSKTATPPVQKKIIKKLPQPVVLPKIIKPTPPSVPKVPTLQKNLKTKTEKVVPAKDPVPIIPPIVKPPKIETTIIPPVAPRITPIHLPYPGFGGGGGTPIPVVPAQNNLEIQDIVSPNPPIIISPANFSQTFTTETISFSGTAEAQSIISTNFSQATTSTNTNNNWSLNLTFPQSTTTISFFAEDLAGNKSSAATTTFFIDSQPPNDISLIISECSNSLSSSGCLLATTTLNISWASQVSDLNYFVTNQNGSFATTTATSTVVSVPDDTQYVFEVSAYDMTGNRSATSTKTAEIFTRPVIINEIAWSGTASSTADEWIELYNRSSQNINLTDWVLHAQDGVPYLNLSGIIPSNGYYLIERSDDNTIRNIVADLTLPFSGLGSGSGLSNYGETLILSYVSPNQATTTIDQTAVTPSRRWSAGRTYFSMERYSPNDIGNMTRSWTTNNGLIKNGEDAGGNPINGTPKARNSANYLITKGSSYISNNITLTKALSPYFVNGFQSFQNGAILNIEPGVVIKFKSGGFQLYDASIQAPGTEQEPIVFTNFYDDAYGGDLNGDGICDPSNASSTAQCPQSGSWQTIYFYPQSNPTPSLFDHNIFRYGGGGWGVPLKHAILQDDGVSPEIKNSLFEYSKNYSLKLSGSNSLVTNNIFRNDGINNLDTALYIVAGAPTIENNTFENNTKGLYSISSSADIRNNSFVNNRTEAIHLNGNIGGIVSGNSGSGNGINAIKLQGTIALSGATTTLRYNPLPYFLYSYVSVMASSTLAIEDNVVVWGGLLDIFGHLKAVSSRVGGIIFQSQLNNPSKNSWSGIRMQPGSSSNLEGVSFNDANTALSYIDSPVSLTNVSFGNNNLAISVDYNSQNNYPLNVSGVSFVNNTATTSPSGLW